LNFILFKHFILLWYSCLCLDIVDTVVLYVYLIKMLLTLSDVFFFSCCATSYGE